MTEPVTAVYEGGVLRPASPPPGLVDGATVRLLILPADADPPTVRDVLARRYNSGVPDTAARHDEHQP